MFPMFVAFLNSDCDCVKFEGIFQTLDQAKEHLSKANLRGVDSIKVVRVEKMGDEGTTSFCRDLRDEEERDLLAQENTDHAQEDADCEAWRADLDAVVAPPPAPFTGADALKIVFGETQEDYDYEVLRQTKAIHNGLPTDASWDEINNAEKIAAELDAMEVSEHLDRE